ncbi:hypothetical protein ACFVHB_34000 [Kitasatospora sp. NPDC127111]|uniref:hypothetical protein n=1 Tax=Kitasatospora sp. NPDC127111 TaxID=3345363 RepID=UPI00364591BF
MTTLDQTATASDLPSAGPSSPGLPSRAEGGTATSAAPVVLCSIAAATDSGAAGASRDGSVPRPRGGASEEGADGAGVGGAGAGVGGAGAAAGGHGGDAGEQTTAVIRAGLAERLRTAYGEGRSPVELAAVCRRPVAEVHSLSESAGAEASPGSDSGPGGFIRLQPPAASAGAPAVPVLRAAQEELRIVRSKRPSPSRRLRRMHPEVAAAEQVSEQTWRADAAVPPSVAAGAPAPVTETRGGASPAGGGDGAAALGGGADAGAETPLGILIGGTPNLPEAVGRPEEREPVRVTAELIRIGRGTVLVVLPAWRPAIAVSVPTEHLLHATGLGFDRLADTQLSVLINPGALHDRELDLHGWQAGPAGRAGRRGGRPAL